MINHTLVVVFFMCDEKSDVVKEEGIRLPSRTCEVATTKDASPKFAYLVLRNSSCIFKMRLA